MEQPRSYAVFEDGHEEDLLYLEINKSGGSIFATKSGIYRFCPIKDIIDGTKFKRLTSYFERLGADSTDRTDEIKYVTVDERILYKYELNASGRHISGSVLAPPNATDSDVCKLIVEKMGIVFHKE